MCALPLCIRSHLVDEPPAGPVVYFLLAGDEVVYVGATVHPRARMNAHRHAGRQFDRVAYLPVTAENLVQSERHWIGVCQPTLNKQHKARTKAAPVCLNADEVYWATLLAKYRGQTVSAVLSPILRDRLRAAVRGIGIDPDKAWSAVEGKA